MIFVIYVLNPVARHQVISVHHMYYFDMTRFLILDHFILSAWIFNSSVVKYTVLHEMDNLSDHKPLLLVLCLPLERLMVPSDGYASRPAW